MKKIIMVLLGLMLLGSASIGLTAEDKWEKKSDMPTARMGLSTSVVNGKIYAIGGWDGAKALSIVEVYDPLTDNWVEKSDMPTPRSCLPACVVNGKIYAIGGAWDPAKPGGLSNVEVYDPLTDTWEKKADMPTARGSFAASAVNGKIYVIGGYNGVWLSNAVEEYTPATDTWSKKAPTPFSLNWIFSSVVDEKIYVFGGNNGVAGLSLVEEYNPTTDKWTKIEDEMPTARFGLSTSEANGKIYAIGGWTWAGFVVFPTVEEYNPATGIWSKKADMPTAKRDFREQRGEREDLRHWRGNLEFSDLLGSRRI